MMDFLELIRTRKSVRSFSDQPVARDLVEKVLTAATYAPTNCNQQLWNFTIIEDEVVKERLIKEAASNTLIRRAPVVVVVSYDGWNYKEAIQGGSLAAGHMLLAATHYGLGALPMNSYGADSQIKKILHLPPSQTICCFVLLGYPDPKALTARAVPRRPVAEVMHWGTFSRRPRASYQYNPETWSPETLTAHQQYYCRKTFLGKEMDIMSAFERRLVARELERLSGAVLDLASYDGAYVREFPSAVSLTTLDLCRETADYTRAAGALAGREISALSLNASADAPSTSFQATTLVFKLERLPSALRQELYQWVQGEFIIIARKRHVLLSLFFVTIKMLFGPDVRRTGIFTFFGPYQPVSLGQTLRELRAVGFRDISWNGYFAFPAFFEQVYQMLLQYRASEGSSYLHRERRTDSISKIIDLSLRFQGLARCGGWGSVVVIRCRR